MGVSLVSRGSGYTRVYPDLGNDSGGGREVQEQVQGRVAQ